MDAELEDEAGRLRALDRYGGADTGGDRAFDRITRLVRRSLAVPISFISLIDDQRQWLKSICGLDITDTSREASFCRWTIGGRDVIVVEDATRDPRFARNPLVTGPPHLRAYLGVPLETPDGYNVGTLCAADVVPRTFTADDIDTIVDLAALVVDELELRQAAVVDALTGALSRRGFLQAVGDALHRAHETGPCLAIVDVDHFKAINDEHGHPAGDRALVAVAQRLEASMPAGATVGRLGGEEFGVLMPERGLADAASAAEAMRRAVATGAVLAEPPISLTASFGLAEAAPDTRPGELVAAADRALYVAKAAGRNRVETAAGSAERRGPRALAAGIGRAAEALDAR